MFKKYSYKASSLDPQNPNDNLIGNVNDYSYNLGSESKEYFNYREVLTNYKYSFNKEDFYNRK